MRRCGDAKSSVDSCMALRVRGDSWEVHAGRSLCFSNSMDVGKGGLQRGKSLIGHRDLKSVIRIVVILPSVLEHRSEGIL